MHVTIVVDALTSNAPSVGCQLRVSVKRLADLGLVEDPFTRNEEHGRQRYKLVSVQKHGLSGVVDAS